MLRLAASDSAVKEAQLHGLVANKVLVWFYVGEIRGKRGITGCDV